MSARRCCMWCSGKGERLGYERFGFDPAGLLSFFFLMETLSITDQTFSKWLKKGSDRLRKGNLHHRPDTEENSRIKKKRRL